MAIWVYTNSAPVYCLKPFTVQVYLRDFLPYLNAIEINLKLYKLKAVFTFKHCMFQVVWYK